MRKLFIKIVVCSFLASFSLAATEAGLKNGVTKDCNSKDFERIMSGCSAVISGDAVGKYFLAVAHLRRSIAYLQQREFDKAIADLSKVVEIYPTSTTHKARLAAVFALRGQKYVGEAKFFKAILDFEIAYKLQPNEETFKKRLVELFDLVGDKNLLDNFLKESIAAYSKAVNLGKTAELLASRAEAHIATNEVKNAIKDLSEAINLKPEFAKAYRRRGEMHLSQDATKKAIADFGEVLKRNSKDTDVLLLRALAFEKENSTSDANKDYKAILKLDRKNSEAKEGIERLKNSDIFLTKLIQTELSLVGFNPGPVDGQWGKKSSAALKAYIENTDVKNSLTTARPTEQALRYIRSGSPKLAKASPAIKQQATGFKLYANRDMYGDDFSTLKKVSFDICREKCKGNTRCRAFSFDKWNRYCFLKSSLSQIRLEPKSITGVLENEDQPLLSTAEKQTFLFKGKKMPGNSFYTTNTDSPEICEIYCMKNDQCIAFSYNRGNNRCRLLDTAEEYFSNSKFDSGVKRHRAVQR